MPRHRAAWGRLKVFRLGSEVFVKEEVVVTVELAVIVELETLFLFVVHLVEGE